MLSTSSSRALVRPVGALVAVLCLTAGCASAGAGGPTPGTAPPTPVTSTSPSSTPPPSTPPSVDAGLTNYVALGDSYTAAPLFRPDARIRGCLRSPDNYPAQVARANGLTLTDVSCSGATTDNMVEPQRFAKGGAQQPPQFDALTPDTDLVTVGIGANDFRFFGRMIIDCIALAPSDRSGSPCERANEIAPAPQRIEDKLDVITTHVASVAKGIKQRTPGARVLMVGYPQLLPAAGRCGSKLPLAAGDYGFVRRLNLSLADAVRAGALQAEVDYVDLIEASQGHDICSKKPWIAGVRGPQRLALGLHPYRREQRAVAGLVSQMLS